MFQMIGRTCIAVVTLTLLAACGTSPSPPLMPPANQGAAGEAAVLPTTARVAAGAARPRAGGPWLGSTASQGALLYVSDYIAWNVDVYGYPANTLVGALMGQKGAGGECVDASGNVYIVDEDAAEVFEFAHGGASPIATFRVPRERAPVSCAIDPTTGDLAVANIETANREPGPGDVVVYAKGQKRSARFTAPNFFGYYFVGYDDRGNLFVDGTAGRPGVGSVRFEYAELPAGQQTMVPITLKGGSIAFPGNVQWDGTHITIGDQNNAVIYQTKGAKIVGSTPLTGSSDCAGYFIYQGTVICPDAGNKSVEFYNYPAGGQPTGTITGFDDPAGAVVSP